MKIETKFHIGDWIVNNGHSYLIAGIDYLDNRYLFEIGGYTHEQLNWEYIEDVDGKYHLWTIEDAKDGDVLVDEDNNIGIYKEIEGICWHSYFYLGCNIHLYGFSIGGSHVQNNTKPATKEQRDLLFKKIHEAGYMWDANKRELKKTENSEYHTPNPPMNKRQKTDDKVIVTLIEYIKNEIIDDTHNPYTAHGHEVLMELLAAYNHYQETESDGMKYIFNIENSDDVICRMKRGMTSKEVCDLYSASQSTHTKYFYHGYNDNGASQISTMDELRTNIIEWLDEIVTCVIAFPDEDKSYRAIYTRYITNELT